MSLSFHFTKELSLIYLNSKNSFCCNWFHGHGWISLQWRHSECYGVLNHQRLECLLQCLFMLRSKETARSASLAFVRGIHRWPVNSPQKGPVRRKMFPLSDVIMHRCYITFAVRASVCEGGGRGFMSSPRLLRKLGKQRAFRVLMLGQGGVGKTGEVIYVSVHHNDVRCSVSDQRPLQRVDSLFRLTPTSNKRSALLAFCEATPSVTGVGDLYAIGSIIFMQSVIDVDDLQKPRGVVWWQLKPLSLYLYN